MCVCACAMELTLSVTHTHINRQQSIPAAAPERNPIPVCDCLRLREDREAGGGEKERYAKWRTRHTNRWREDRQEERG